MNCYIIFIRIALYLQDVLLHYFQSYICLT
uniref:Uncharacterized protein n=1 Tax=Rhizophora mucronata TaxID=61149 RepID=A0A2P2IJ01_RHIMU